ncbi:tRNA (cytidine(34)-2'-O)-methyltransferase [Candidatus Avelusimicrobium facis]|uniref:tRNA (cytidine(34)-2'-O)-methyltransferase n=1 Tax=Candidatus Avelusimicrobium facis TaxID=3416203 RepID=UPI0015B65932
MLNIVLINPEIPFNTGNIGRSCVATGTRLHLVGKLGFKINSKEIRRSGLDYWPNLDWKYYETWEQFLQENRPDRAQLFFLSTKGTTPYWDAAFPDGAYLCFGAESCGLPKDFYHTYQDRLFTIPMTGPVRSLNLSSSAAITLFEALRQHRKTYLK